MSTLPGLAHRQDLFDEVTYPVFVPTETDLLFECRTGKAGAGSEMLFHYSPSTQSYSYTGTYLVGVGNNPYINGLSYRDGKLHVSWTYRGFVDYEGVNEVASMKHKAQAGPNGPENNYDLMYAWSGDFGRTWRSSAGAIIAEGKSVESDEGDAGESATAGVRDGIFPDTPGVIVQHIPKYSGIINQEAQFIGSRGDFHALNRDNRELWRHFMRDGGGGGRRHSRGEGWSDSHEGNWSSTIITQVTPTETGSRGKIVQDGNGDVYIVLPGNEKEDSSLTVLRRRMKKGVSEGDGEAGIRESRYEEGFEVVWRGEGYDGEPLIDEKRLHRDGEGEGGVLCIFTRTLGPGAEVIVLDFTL